MSWLVGRLGEFGPARGRGVDGRQCFGNIGGGKKVV